MTAPIKPIDTAKMSEHLRGRAIDISARKVLISRLAGSDQESDLTVPSNCNGYGRIRHFRQQTSDGLADQPLAYRSRLQGAWPRSSARDDSAGLSERGLCLAVLVLFRPIQSFERRPDRSEWLTADDLVQLYRNEAERPLVIDLTGGSPDLVPEWTPWMMRALADAGLDSNTFLWTDDNLSTTYLFDLRLVFLHNFNEGVSEICGRPDD